MCQEKPKRQNILVMVFFTQRKWSLLYSLVLAMRRFCFTIQVDRRPWRSESFPSDLSEPTFYGNVVGIGPLHLAIRVVQNRRTGEQKSPWDKTNKKHT